MYREYIRRPIDPIPLEYVNKLNRINHEPDYSLTSLGIALIKPRLEKNGITYSGFCGEFAKAYGEANAIDHFVTSCKDHDNLIFSYYVYRDNADNEDAIKELLKANNFETKENISTFLKEKANIRCRAIYSTDKNQAAIFINNDDIKYYHVIISFLSLLYPNIFKDQPMVEAEYNVVKACSKVDKDAFVLRVQEVLQPYATEFKRLMLNGILNSLHEEKVKKAYDELEQQREYVNRCRDALCDAAKSLKRLSAVYEGFKATEVFDEAEEELVEYLVKQKEIKAMQMVDTSITFAVATLLNNYNSDAWQVFAERGAIYDGQYYEHGTQKVELLDVFKNIENRKILLNNIFSESPEFAVKIAGNYSLDLDSSYVRSNKQYEYVEADPIFKSYLPNPHMKLFSCLGGYEDKIHNMLMKRDYIVAIEMCCASAGSVDLDETEQTFRPFIGWIMASKEKILRRKDGVDMTPEEALIYLIDKEKENETN